jgi:aspartyl aminopeptidase
VSLVALFDHEEVGSSSTTGAGSTIIEESVKRISMSLKGEDEPKDYLEVRGGNAVEMKGREQL